MKLKPIVDKQRRYGLRELTYRDYSRLREMNADLFFAPLRHVHGPVGFLQQALRQQHDPHRRQYFMGVVITDGTGEGLKEQRKSHATIGKSDTLVGCVMILDLAPNNDNGQSAEIAYFIDPHYQRIHFATDATVSLLKHLKKKLNINRVTATVDPDNKPSLKIIRRLGFHQTGYIAESPYKGDPNNPEHYDPDHELMRRPRLAFEAPIEALFTAAKGVAQKPAAIRDQTILKAFCDHFTADGRADTVRRNLRNYLRLLVPKPPRVSLSSPAQTHGSERALPRPY